MEDPDEPAFGKRFKFKDSRLALPKTTGMKTFLHEYFCGQGNLDAGRKEAVIFDSAKGVIERLTYDQLNLGANAVKEFLGNIFPQKVGAQEFLGVNCAQGKLYPILVLGILRAGHAFYNIDPDNVERSLKDGIKFLGMKYILSQRDYWQDTPETRKVKDIFILEDTVPSFVVHEINEKVRKPDFVGQSFAYAIQTSGSTGLKKTVLVPHTCICPNIEDFVRNHWKLDEKDVIFGSAPPTFDPHVVELFSALAVGATIVYTTASVKMNGSLLASLLAKYNVSILQVTPTMFRRLTAAIVLNTSLSFRQVRAVTFGGEKCADREEIRRTLSAFPNPRLIFQNVYGVTEVSCWASLSTIDLNSTNPITVGQGLLETDVSLDGELDGEIIISSERRFCKIINPSSSNSVSMSRYAKLQYHTGDMGTMTPDGIVFKGRADRTVKRNGMKVSLPEIEASAMSSGLVTFAECKLYEGKIFLVVTIKSECESSKPIVTPLQVRLGNKLDLPLHMYPDYIIPLTMGSIPLNSNGKLDWNSIIKSFHANNIKSEHSRVPISKSKIIQCLAPIWTSCTRPQPNTTEEVILCQNFVAHGGTSVSATRFIESSFMALALFGSKIHQTWEHDLLQTLLDEENGTLGRVATKICEMLTQSSKTIITTSIFDENMLPETQEKLPKNIFVHSCQWSSELDINLMSQIDATDIFHSVEEISNTSVPVAFKLPPEPNKMYRFPLSLCVDASPATVPFKNETIIGCHGGLLICVNLDALRVNDSSPSKAIVWAQKFPNRLEASVEVHPNSLFLHFGCHDGNLYKVLVSTGKIVCWFAVGSPIRSKCAYYDNMVIFVDSDNSIHCADAQVLNEIWRVKSFKILATMCPVIFRDKCLLATLDKGIVSLECQSGTLLWSTSTDLIYSSPLLIHGNTKVQNRKVLQLVCASNKGIEARNVKSGTLQWSHKSDLCYRIHQPMFNSCCNCIIWVESAPSELSYLNFIRPTDGQVLKKIELSHNAPVALGLLYSESNSTFLGKNDKFPEKTCYLLYKSSAKDQVGIRRSCMKVVHLHETVLESKSSSELKVKPNGISQSFHVELSEFGNVKMSEWSMDNMPDFETFSKPTMCSEYILFGGRDNNLHVIKLKV